MISFWGHYTEDSDCSGYVADNGDWVEDPSPRSAEDNEEMKVKRILVNFRERQFAEDVAGGRK